MSSSVNVLILYQGIYLLHQQGLIDGCFHICPFGPGKSEADIRAGRVHDHPLFSVGKGHGIIIKLALLQRMTELHKIFLLKIQQQVMVP